MIVYTPTSNNDVAAQLSDALWALALPPFRRGKNTTQRLFGSITDTQGRTWLEVDTGCEIPIHGEAELGDIGTIILGAGLPQSDVDQLEALIISLRGQRMVPWDYFPAVFKDASKTREEMAAENLLPNVPTP